jgi:class 3 adenylate cyclase
VTRRVVQLTVCGSDLKPECFYDVWGDTVTVARRLETSAEPNLPTSLRISRTLCATSSGLNPEDDEAHGKGRDGNVLSGGGRLLSLTHLDAKML